MNMQSDIKPAREVSETTEAALETTLLAPRSTDPPSTTASLRGKTYPACESR